MILVDLAPQRYQESPCMLAGMILWFLGKEKEILQTARLDEQVCLKTRRLGAVRSTDLTDQLGVPCYQNVNNKVQNQIKE